MYGVKLGAAKLEPKMGEGVVTLPPATIPALDGKVNLAGEVDLAPAAPAG